MSQSHRLVCINISRDICLKLIERRAMSPDQLSGSMRFLSTAALNLCRQLNELSGVPVIGLARDITVKMVELNMVSNVQAASVALAEYGQMVAEVASQLDVKTAPSALKAARDLTLKMLETGRLGRNSLPALFEELAVSLAEKASEKLQKSGLDAVD